MRDLLDTPIDEMELSTRLRGCCINNGIKTLRQFVQAPPGDWLRTPNLGRTTFAEIKAILDSMNLTPGMTDDELHQRFSADRLFIDGDYT